MVHPRNQRHVTGLRSDGVSPQILSMDKIVSEDALRRALGKIPEAERTEWMRPLIAARISFSTVRFDLFR